MMLKNDLKSIMKNPQLTKGVNAYRMIKDRFELAVNKTQPAFKQRGIDQDIIFVSVFKEFYGLKGPMYDDVFINGYFNLFNAYLADYRKTHNVPKYDDVLKKLRDIPNNGKKTYQPVFATKLIHTFNNNAPIYDSVVGDEHFGYSRSNFDYKKYCSEIKQYANSSEGKKIIKAFDRCFPKSGITKVKKIDFVLWVDR